MFQAFLNMFRVAELRNKLLFTVAMLFIYRVGFFIPLAAIDQGALAQWASKSSGAMSDLISFVGIFTGGTFSQSTIFGLGIMPYISASIIFQLLGTVLPSLQALQKEGAVGQQKINEWTRYSTIGLCLIQGFFWLEFINRQSNPYMVHLAYRGTPTFWLCGLTGLTAGTVFLMWLGEQIDKYGIGNGVSLIITSGIVARMPAAVGTVYTGVRQGTYGLDMVIFLVAAFIAVVAGSIVITLGQRRIPIQQAKHTRGRRVFGGQKSYLPLRVNHGGVMPIIFASALMMFPTLIFGWLSKQVTDGPFGTLFAVLAENFSINRSGYLYVLCDIALIYFFAYFWTTVQFQPTEMATQLRDHGSFIPGLRPGPRTAEYLETVMERITYVGAGFLAIIAVIPTVVASAFHIDYQVTAFLGGTGLLIVVSVMLDFVQRIEASLAMRNYKGFLDGGNARSRNR